MKTRKILWLMLALLPALSFAQDDDMYFVPKKSKTTKVVKTNTSQQQETRVVPRTTVPETQAEYYSGTLRDVDE